jgi:dipeptidyl aminopeptidase/acylaminoacyl peptidase
VRALEISRWSTVLGAVIACQVAFGVQSASAQAEEPEPLQWSPELSIQLDLVGAVAMSPDGSRIAYTVREALVEGEQSEYLTHIWMVDGDGPRQFTRGEQSATNPAFTPDGTGLLFLSDRNGTMQVWALPLRGGEAYQVTDAPAAVSSFAISPDGEHLAYAMADTVPTEWKTAEREKRDVIVADTDFRYTHLYLVPFGAGKQDHADRLTEGDFTVTGWDWSPASDAIVFSHRSDPRLNTARLDGDVSVAELGYGDAVESVVRPLATGPGVESNPFFSPDGSLVAFESTGRRLEPVGLGDVYVVAAGGGEPRKLHDTHDRAGGLQGWSRDGDGLMVVESIGTTRHVELLPVDGSAPRRLTNGEGVVGAVAWASRADRMAFTWQTLDTPADVWTSPTDSWDPRKLTQQNGDLKTPEAGRTELLSWRSEDGRFEIEGLLTYPVGYRPGERVPLVLNVHGGPSGVFGQSFTGAPGIYMIQSFAQAGYAVLRPNPRGSTGYGRDFRYANVADWGYGDMDDLMAGVDHVIEMGVADPDRLLLMGWSYGGYMTSFAVTRTDRFKAASMGAGLPNLVSMVTTTDIQEYLAAHMGAEFWEDFEAYEKHSAIYRIANVTTPTQVIHGANDVRVPFTQGQEFYRALQRRGVDTEMLILPRTPHGPQEPKLLMEVTPRILTWFAKHLPETTPIA